MLLLLHPEAGEMLCSIAGRALRVFAAAWLVVCCGADAARDSCLHSQISEILRGTDLGKIDIAASGKD